MNSPQRITRHLVKAVSAGALVLAAALPMAVASSAGAADVPVTGAWLADGSVTTVLNPSTAVTTSSTSIALVSTAAYTVPAGDLLFDSTTNTPLGVASAQATSATTTPFGATVTLNAASLAAAATTDTIVLYKPMAIGTGGSGTMYVSGSGFANNGSTVTVSSSAPGLTFSSASEKSATWATASYASTSATVAGSYTVAITDGNGTSATPLAGAITVNAAPTYTSLTPTSLTTGSAAATVTITGTGFVSGATVSFTSTVDGTTLASTNSATGAFTSGKVSTGTQGESTFGSSTSLSVKVSPTNSVTGSAATAGTYTVTITNPDGGTVTSAAAFTITSYGVTNLSPSAIPVPTSATTNTVVTVNGAGFQYGASVALSACSGTGTAPTIAANSTTVTSTSTITMTVTVTAGYTAGDCTVTVSNPSVANGGNGATFPLAHALGIGQASTVAATITGATPNTPIVPGAATSVLTLTGTGFSQYSTAAAFVGTSTTSATGVTVNNCGGNSGTTLICYVTVATGALSGADSVVVSNSTAASTGFPGAINVAGPVITSQTPAAIAVGAPIGTVITLNGTGFTNTTSGVVAAGTSGLAGIVSYSSPTAMTLVITTSPTAASTTASPTTVTLTQTVAGSTTAVSSAFPLTVNAAPTVTGAVTYAVGSGVGVGATAQTVYIHGNNFSAGSTVGTFVNANGVADTHVTATVVTVTTSQITAKIAITAGDTNIAVGYTVKSTDGGSYVVSAIAYPIIINAGPTITSVTPATATAGSTTAFTVVGTGFATGAVVSLTANGTCGTTTVVSATTVTASCTLGAAGSTASYLTVSNTDGGTATSATAVLAAAAVKPPVTKVNLHTTGAHGVAMVGKTVVITITGGGFYGQPRLTSNAAGVKAVVIKDNGKMLTVRVTVRAGAARGWHTFTIRLANGKMAKVNYLTK